MTPEIFDKITLIHGDCMDYLRTLPDNAFDLAICDPPYGGAGNDDFNGRWQGGGKRINKYKRFHGRFDRYKIDRTGGTWASKYKKDINAWDIAPDDEYFEELFRVSKNQIIWGGNYFELPPTRCFVVWQKFIPEQFTMAMCEYAWTSFNDNAKFIKLSSNGSHTGTKRFHPTEKPVALYKWLLKNYAKEGDRILDSHLGSGSIAIAAHDGGFELTGIEIDGDYYNAAKKRLTEHQKQIRLF